MPVIIGSARIDERGKARGGKAGDQTGHEVEKQAWYNRITNPWVLLRPKLPAHAEKIARCMEMACANQRIGYDQGGRDTLYSAAGMYGYDVSKVAKAVETDCSALVRVCCAYAGITAPNFRTTTQASVLMATGHFEKYTASKYIHSSAYLRRGDILVTKRQGHTVVVLTDGPKAGKVYALGERTLQKGADGPDVTAMQKLLLALDYSLGKWGADGDFGSATLAAVKAFQADAGMVVDGIMDSADIKVLQGIAANGWPKPPTPVMPPTPAHPYTNWVVATEDVNIRSGPGTQYKKRQVLLKGTGMVFDGAISGEWYAVWWYGRRCWVSSKYTRIVVGEKPLADVSKYDNITDFDAFSQQVSYVWVRAGARVGTSTGILLKDSKLDKHCTELAKRGVPSGVYFYGRAKTVKGAQEEAAAVLRWAGKYKPTTVAYDIETATNTHEAVQAFVDAIEAAGIRCGIYVGRKWSQVKAEKLRVAFRWGPYYRDGSGGLHGRDPTNKYDVHQYACAYKFRGKSDGGDVSHLHGTVTIEQLRSGFKEVNEK